MLYWRLFNKKPVKPVIRSVIVGEDGEWPLSDHIRELGETEGWLVYQGYHRDEHNRVVLRFRMTQ